MCLRTAVWTIAMLWAAASGAAAQNLAETVSKWGLIGTWAIDCTKPPSGTNGHFAFAIRRAGQVSYERDFGDRQDLNEVRAARTTPAGTLEVEVNYPKLEQTRKLTFMMGTDGRTRTVGNTNIDGTQPSIRDGKFTHNNTDAPWQARCR